ncbi:MAG: PQQ-dependent dehydrogenase, methanol/ethanol family, partial [Gammaproteobacteria bacterium]
MRKLNKKWVFAALSLAVPSVVFANDSVEKLIKDPNYWAFPGGNYWNWRYSALDQINTSNVNKLQMA